MKLRITIFAENSIPLSPSITEESIKAGAELVLNALVSANDDPMEKVTVEKVEILGE